MLIMKNIQPETIYKPKYNGSMRFALLLYPGWVGLCGYFLYAWLILNRPFNPQGFLAIVFGIMTISLPFRVFREVHFGERIIVKRYLLPDIIMEYEDIVAYDSARLDTRKKGIALDMLHPDSRAEFDKIIQRLMSARKIKLKKK